MMVLFRWERDGRQSQAACWLVFLGRYSKAIDILMRSKGWQLVILGSDLYSSARLQIARITSCLERLPL
jgi:SEA/GATOR complex protein SEA4/MIOS